MERVVRAVLYLRMSNNERVVSVNQQREDCRSYCAQKKYEIVGEYIEEGDPEFREHFQKLIKDSARNEWEVVVCWTGSLFGRHDRLDTQVGEAILLRKGIVLETVMEGIIDWPPSLQSVGEADQGDQTQLTTANSFVKLLLLAFFCGGITGALGGGLRASDPPESTATIIINPYFPRMPPAHVIRRGLLGMPIGIFLGLVLGASWIHKSRPSVFVGIFSGFAGGFLGDLSGSILLGSIVGAVVGTLFCFGWGVFDE
jgi:hypothetical protein